MPRPAVIQLTSPGVIDCTLPRLSRWTIVPSKRYVTLARPMWGWGRTSIPFSSISSAGPIWSKKINGPTIWRCVEGSTRRTSNPPRSRARELSFRSILPCCGSRKFSSGAWLSKTGICSRQDAKNAKFGRLIPLRPLRRRSGHALRLGARYSEFWLRLRPAGLKVLYHLHAALSNQLYSASQFNPRSH
jgi:hypothetical protein